ncbi:transglycosylase-like protein with SLT domain [Roseinatronobacter thiooxidans]|uniref:Transglycosylase-like protein with SLT domain n=2 Tax=Roseinatronobacter thiooxidans TaxID=121821 RepID=A0A2W7R1D8_9RHOB|nr:transglycosylase-like protein with SLT domain [Roseinatronobacter thiooxidans]
MIRSLCMALVCLGLAACGKPGADVSRAAPVPTNLYPGETPQMRELVRRYAAKHDIPEALLHRVIQRESDYRAHARNGPYWGLMQILPQTAQQMGFRGAPQDLLDAETNLEYAGRYLRGAWLVSNGNIDAAVMWYARGYYYEARNRCMLVATGLRTREVRRDCPQPSRDA